MKNPELPPYPEREPDPALFSLVALYALQPRAVRIEHRTWLNTMFVSAKSEIRWYELELLDRRDGVEKLPLGFEVFKESASFMTDEDIREAIDYQRDRMLTIVAHRSLVGSIYGGKQFGVELPDIY